jgi:hypothetical protein
MGSWNVNNQVRKPGWRFYQIQKNNPWTGTGGSFKLKNKFETGTKGSLWKIPTLLVYVYVNPLISIMVSTMASNTTIGWYQMSRYSPPYHYTPSIKLQMFWWIPYQSDIKFFDTKLIFDIKHSSSFFPWYQSLILLLVYILKYFQHLSERFD